MMASEMNELLIISLLNEFMWILLNFGYCGSSPSLVVLPQYIPKASDFVGVQPTNQTLSDIHSNETRLQMDPVNEPQTAINSFLVQTNIHISYGHLVGK